MDGFFRKSSPENYESLRRREYFEFRFGGEKVKRVASEGAQKRGWATELRRGFKKSYQLHLIALLPMVMVLVFAYIPMGGIVLAWKKYL